MKIAIIGAGFTGLAAAHQLGKDHNITVFEKNLNPGGLAQGFKQSNWDWSLEDHYHHIFTSDKNIYDLALKVRHPIDFYQPKTSTWIDNHIYQLDSVASLMRFTPLSMISRIRTGIGMASLKLNPFWKPYEYFTAKKMIQSMMGNESWEKLWSPLFFGKFHSYAEQISAAWFWSRIYKRSQSLGYPRKGFLSLAKTIESNIISNKAKFIYGTTVERIKSVKGGIEIRADGKSQIFDRVVCTLPTAYFCKITPEIEADFVRKYTKIEGLGAINLILSLKNNFFSDGTYWLNINDKKIPFLAVVEHTNFISEKFYHNEHLIYVGLYAPSSDQRFSYSEKELLSLYLPHLQKINPNFSEKQINNIWLKKAAFAQPIIPIHYSKSIPPIRTSMKNVFLANMQQVYPWDRGTNYAVKLGMEVAKECTTN